MEHIKPEQEQRELSDIEKFGEVLKLFGTDQAREGFLATCKEYISTRRIENTKDGENYSRDIKYSHPKRADLHNTIMDILSRLATQSKNISPQQETILRKMHNRDDAAEIIRAYVVATEHQEDEDEDEKIKRRQTMSGTAYFHSLGKGE